MRSVSVKRSSYPPRHKRPSSDALVVSPAVLPDRHAGAPVVALRVRAASLLSAIALLAGCSSVTTSEASDRAHASLRRLAVHVHERALSERAGDPTAAGAAAARRLGDAVTGGNPASLVSAKVTANGVEVVTTIGVQTEVGGGLGYEQTTLGACLLISATTAPDGDITERGTVSTEAIPCPDGVVPLVDSAPVETTTMALERVSSAVPTPKRRPCSSGSGNCESGGG